MQLFALNAEVAELETRIAELTGPERLPLLVTLAWYLRQSQTDRALALAEAAGALLAADAGSGGGDPHGIAGRIALVHAEADMLRARLDDAVARTDEALAAFRLAHDATGTGDAHLIAAQVASNRGDMAGRTAQLARARKAYGLAGEAVRRQVVEIWQAADTAFVNAEAARGLAEELAAVGDAHPAVMSAIHGFLGPFAFQRSDFVRAVDHYRRGFEAGMSIGQIRPAIIMASNVAAAFNNLNDHAAALDWAERALDLARPTGWPALLGITLIQAASALRGLGRFDAAKTLLTDGIATLGSLARSVIYCSACQYLGDICLDLGELEPALDWLDQSQTIARELGRRDLLSLSLRGRAQAYARLGRKGAALKMAEAALAIAEEDGNRINGVEALRARAEIRREGVGGQADDVLDDLERAMATAESIEGFAIPTELFSELAQAHAARGDMARAYGFEVRAGTARRDLHSKQARDLAVAMQIRLDLERARAEAGHHRVLAASEAARAQTLLQATETLTLLGRIGQEITAKLDPQAVFEALHRHILGLVDAPMLAIFLLAPDGRSLELRYGVEVGKRLPAQRIPMNSGTSHAVRCLSTRAEILVEMRSGERDPAHLAGTERMLTACFGPLTAAERTLGVLTIQSPRPNAYGERERLIFQTLCAYGAIALANAEVWDELERRSAAFERLALVDALTGIGNRRQFEDRAVEALGQASRHGWPLSVVTVDIDHFKSVNDWRGHGYGDAVLRHVAARLRSALRPGDFVARMGGEEFAVILPETALAEAVRIAERLRHALIETAMAADASGAPVTASFGVAGLGPGDRSVADVLDRSDQALYRAKQQGRNRVAQ